VTSPDDDEVFTPTKIYPRTLEAWAEAHDAFELGFITAWEREELIKGRMVINHDYKLVNLNRLLPNRLLTRSRMIEIQADQLLGLSDGTTHIR
jgi:hypothetical protein